MLLATLERERRAVRVRVAGEERWIAADDAGLYRDALGAVPPGGLPEAFLERRPRRARALVRALRAHPRPVHHRRAARRATASTRPRRCEALERAGDLVRGELRPGGTRARVVRPRGAAPPAPRVARRPAQGDRGRRPARARRVPAVLAGRRPPSRRRARASTACARCSSRSRGSRCPPTSGSATCCRAASAPTRRPGWTSSARRGEVVWVGAGALGRNTGRVALYFREDAEAIGPAGRARAEPPARARARARCASGSRAVAVLLHRPARRARRWRPRSCRRRCGTSCGRAR